VYDVLTGKEEESSDDCTKIPPTDCLREVMIAREKNSRRKIKETTGRIWFC